MSRLPKQSELIESIYDAGLNPELWSDVVVMLNGYIGSQACGLISKDPVSKSGATHYYCGVDPHYIQLYAETYAQYDPLARLPQYGEVRNIPDLVNFDEYRRGRFYQEWLRPQGCVDVANVVLEQSKSPCPMLLTVIPGRDMLDAAQRARMQFLVPHTSRALLINRAIERKQRHATALADVVDRLNAGVILLDAACNIVHCNPAAETILAADDVLRTVSGRLVTRSSEANLALRNIFRDAGEVAVAAAADRKIPLTSDNGSYYVAHVIALPSLLREGVVGRTTAIGALFVWKAELDGRSSADLIDRTFDLTPAELKVLQSIVEVGGVPETAAALGIAETTVKTHLHRVFAKTGVSRQADLVKLAAGFANPLVR
ncbi:MULTISPECIES: helix-turn-helix transcriptional regulator [Bradyrhizobium]|jgi:DNA-binding CsgD family transcriptional regulator/PAS domain-containing protein|uniref:Helix-turn-helix transcriptional regulator n=1 Tax=Bradyrhizobium arachidis TaxID=858423 RepID=A0AAE7THR1_9BRAD|nr:MULTISPECIES: helix-turn-helix transcriptional regulator [Bradyrhizobium]QOG19297.1 LuxR family transcriptional regulator [Bradyrhizobium sp. SEMIA]QOZ68484.1 helix-turn-helix transcriptional regulator [Bradyrhizobium arachidis]SFV03333.1 DNA-binding transcriptional regulator, CsgD family [Bradyrhizobium arachidis]